jgi:hypothetical protein
MKKYPAPIIALLFIAICMGSCAAYTHTNVVKETIYIPIVERINMVKHDTVYIKN